MKLDCQSLGKSLPPERKLGPKGGLLHEWGVKAEQPCAVKSAELHKMGIFR